MKGEFRLVRDCLSGYIFDSSPVDFTSDLGTKFILHPNVLGMSRPPRLASWIVNGIASSMDALFLKRFESHRAEFWQTLYASVVSVSHLLLIVPPIPMYISAWLTNVFLTEHGSSVSHIVLRR